MAQMSKVVKAAKSKEGLAANNKKSVAGKTSMSRTIAAPFSADTSASFATAISKAVRQKGIQREAIFVSRSVSPKRVYAYSVLPSDTSKIIRESADGSIRVGHFRNGQFRASKAQKVMHAANA